MAKKALTPEQEYNNFWKKIVENPDGSINKEQLMKELFDFSNMINNMCELAEYASCGMLSYPTYPASTIIGVFEEKLQEQYDYGYREGFEDASIGNDKDMLL